MIFEVSAVGICLMVLCCMMLCGFVRQYVLTLRGNLLP